MLLDQPDTLFLDKLLSGPKGGWVIGAPKYMERVGWKDFLRRPVGTGPYMVEGVVKDYSEMGEGESYAKLVANRDYWNEGYPKIQKVTFVQHSSREALDALVEGRVDLVTSLIPKDTLKVAESPLSKVVKGRKDLTLTTILFNLMSPHTYPLRDIRVRKALNYAVNKEELMRYVFKGNAVEMKGLLTERSGVDLSSTKSYEWNIPKARELLEDAGYGEGFKMNVFYQEKDYLIAYLLQRFYSLLKIETKIVPADWEWRVRNMLYPNTREGYSWENVDWWLFIITEPAIMPETMLLWLESLYHSNAPWRVCPGWLLNPPLEQMYEEVLRTTEQERRFEIYMKANEYIADQALLVFSVAPLSLYGVNKELNFVPQVSQRLYLEHSSVTENHWSLRGKKD
jgi:peptide/nickel transport system substrate-binding protein